MLRIHSNKRLLSSKGAAYIKNKKMLLRKTSMQLFTLAVLSTFTLTAKFYHNSAVTNIEKLDGDHQQILTQHFHAIRKNNNIDKALSDFNEIKISERESRYMSLTENFNLTIKRLAHYYGLSDKINVKIFSPTRITPNISRVKLSLSFKSQDDDQTIPLIDSILMNIGGFLFVEQIEIEKHKHYLQNDINLYWYTSTKIEKEVKKGLHFTITPRNSNYNIESNYRVSLWNGNIIS